MFDESTTDRSGRPLGAVLVAAGLFAGLLPDAVRAADDDGTEARIEEIIVTARKREENALKVPISMSVIDDAALQRLGGRGLRDLEFAVPNVTFFDQNDLTKSTVTIRGVSTDVRNIGTEVSFATYLDGILLARPGAFYSAQNDLQQVEILRGPQGTIFGRNSLSGAFSATSKKPTHEFGGEFMLGTGNYDLLEAVGILNGSVIEDRLAGRIALSYHDRDGFVENVFLDQSTGSYSPQSVRGALRFTPSDTLTVDFSIDYAEAEARFHTIELIDETALFLGGCEYPNVVNDPIFGPILCGFVPGARTIADGRPGLQKSTNEGVHLIVDKTLKSGASFQSLSAYRTTETFFEFATQFRPNPLGFGQFVQENEQFSQEFRLVSKDASDDRRFDYVAGLYFLHLPADGVRVVDLEVPLPPGLQARTTTLVSQDTDSYAAYVNANYYFTNNLTLNAGVRYTREEKSYDFLQDGNPQFFTPIMLTRSGDFSENNTSPTVALSYSISEGATAYVKWARGFKPGGFNVDFTVPGLPTDYRSEQMDLYEVGAKMEFLDRRVRINAAAFSQDYTDQQNTVIDPILQGSFVLNAGSAVARGYEIDGTFVPIDGLTLSIGYGYTDARYKDNQPTFEDPLIQQQVDALAGTPLPRTNKHGVNASAAYTHQFAGGGDISLHTSYTYRSSQNFSGGAATGSSDRVNANIVYTNADERWQIELWGRNVTDEDYIASVFANQFVGKLGVIYGAPREYGIRFRYHY